MRAIGLTYPLEIRDAELTGHILAALATDGQVKSDDLQVFTEAGVVTLLGTVDTPYESHRAQLLALAVHGVKRLVNRLTIINEPFRPDDKLLGQVEIALVANPRLEPYRLGSHIKRGVVTVLGRVDTLNQKQAAMDAARRVKGVRDVVSGLKVGQIDPTDEPVPIVDDAVLLGEVSAAISDAGVTIYQNQSYVRDGFVYLRGVVEDRRALCEALLAARRVPGLQGARSRLATQADPSSRDPNEALAGRVVEALHQDGRVSPSQVIPLAYGGVVVLAGQVDSIEDHDAALAVAAGVPGVQKVVDNIRILGREPLRATDRHGGQLRRIPYEHQGR
jgi:osmotically-inducible protein OsmY